MEAGLRLFNFGRDKRMTLPLKRVISLPLLDLTRFREDILGWLSGNFIAINLHRHFLQKTVNRAKPVFTGSRKRQITCA
jgi:hypothetical protein